MSEPIEQAYTKSRIVLCDETIDVKARLDSREEMDALFERLAHVADFLWPLEDAADEEDAEEATLSHETQGVCEGAPEVTSFELPRAVAYAAAVVSTADAPRAPVAPPRAQGVDCLTDEERGLVTFGERQLLGPRQIEAVALKRAGLSLEKSALRMGLSSASNVRYHLDIAHKKGVTP